MNNNFTQANQGWSTIPMQDSQNIILASGEIKHKADITDAEHKANWVALHAERKRCYKALFDNEVNLLQFVGVKAYKETWNLYTVKFINQYGKSFEEQLHQFSKEIAASQTEKTVYNPADVWERIRTFIDYNVDGGDDTKWKVEAAYADKTEKEEGWGNGKLKNSNINIFNIGIPYKWDA